MDELTYKQCKELKDVGFLQNEDGSGYMMSALVDGTIEWVYNPSLSELIEACGGEAKALIQQDNKTMWEYAVDGTGAIGKTPEEAVQKLYLALKKNG